MPIPSASGEEALARLAAAPGALKWTVPLPPSGAHYGHAEILIAAPLAAVRAEVQNFALYTEFDPSRFQKAKVVGRRAGETDVYMQVPIMNGMVTLWDVTRFSPPVIVAQGVERVEGRLVKGNFKDMHVVWTMRAVSPERTVLACDLRLVLNMAVPQDLADYHHRESAAKAVEAIRGRLALRTKPTAD
jgi:ribosome-associated toxin RatA of RatAB toxin-antitoxin module